MIAQAVATSIDAFAVGVSLCASGTSIFTAAPIIGIVTFGCSLLAQALGKVFGSKLGSKAQLLGGVILILIGIKNLLG
jgi:putative Mn2+ efflux pump MntP